MAISAQDRVRANELARELVTITGGRFKNDGTSKTFDELELPDFDVSMSRAFSIPVELGDRTPLHYQLFVDNSTRASIKPI